MPRQLALFDSLEEVYQRIFRELKPRTRLPEFRIRFYPYANVDSTIAIDAERKNITVKISDQLEAAPPSVLEALCYILLCKLYRKPVPPRHDRRYRLYLNRADVRRKALLVRRLRGRKQIHGSNGRVYNLEEIFDDLNARFFHGMLAKPVLSWSRRASRQSLGHFDPAHNTIVISRIFDRPEVPRFLAEYILYHEMLHLKHPTVYRSQRRCVHTKEFKEDERRFPHFAESVRLLKQI